MIRGILLVAAVAGALAAAASAGGLYRSDLQAEAFLEHGLARWDGVNLTRAYMRTALCVNGALSKTEKRTGVTFPEVPPRYDQAGRLLAPPRFRSFYCMLVETTVTSLTPSVVTKSHRWMLYLQTLPGGHWRIQNDH